MLLWFVKTTLLLTCLAFATLAAPNLGCDTSSEDVAFAEQREGLLFGLEDQDVRDLHHNYVPDEDFDLTMARLTAPFECALYDDLCEELGRANAIELTRIQVEMALDEESIDDIEAFTESYVADSGPAPEGEDELTLRSSSGWFAHVIGNIRLKTRNGITSYIVGDRAAWTESITEARSGSGGTWSRVPVQSLCVDTGSNTLENIYTSPSGVTTTTLLDSRDPSNSCASYVSYHKVMTFHDRRNGTFDYSSIRMTARGSSSASFAGLSFSASAPAHTRSF